MLNYLNGNFHKFLCNIFIILIFSSFSVLFCAQNKNSYSYSNDSIVEVNLSNFKSTLNFNKIAILFLYESDLEQKFESSDNLDENNLNVEKNGPSNQIMDTKSSSYYEVFKEVFDFYKIMGGSYELYGDPSCIHFSRRI